MRGGGLSIDISYKNVALGNHYYHIDSRQLREEREMRCIPSCHFTFELLESVGRYIKLERERSDQMSLHVESFYSIV